MRPFDYQRADTVDQAVRAVELGGSGARFLGGGTTLLDLMKCGVELPARLVDVRHLGDHADILVTGDDLVIGAMARMSQVADHPLVRRHCPALAESLWKAASAQIRNMATIGGNVLQRTRCAYFRDPATFPACNKRAPGSGCAAIGGVTRNHAVIGTSRQCIATYPGDMAVVLMAFDARILIAGKGPRTVPAAQFFLPPGDTPHVENVLEAGEIIVGLEIPLLPVARRSAYLKLRDRQSYEFAVASAAVGIELADDGRTVRAARVALGGVATIPWRVVAAETALTGQAFNEASIRTAAEAGAAALSGRIVTAPDNRHKATLIPHVIARAFLSLQETG